MAVHPSVTFQRVIACVEAQDGIGLCAKCGNTQTGCDPLGRNIKCKQCGCGSVFGADEAFMVFLLNDPYEELPRPPRGL
jgi:hypothetical protein